MNDTLPSTDVLCIISSDPRTSGRPAEAVRIAAGVSTWKKAGFTVYLRGPAILCLSEWVDELVDEDNFTRYLPVLLESGTQLLVEKSSPFLSQLGDTPWKFTQTETSDLANLSARHKYVMNF